MTRRDPSATAGLRDFQRASVERAFQRLYLDPDPAHRFLIADEVGLGKTFVARGLIERVKEHLRDSVERIDIVYVCSNGNIAKQNRTRLGLGGTEQSIADSRITLLPLTRKSINARGVNAFVLTPGTSLDLGKSTGMALERALLQRLVVRAFSLSNRNLIYLFRVSAEKERMERELKRIDDMDKLGVVDWSVVPRFQEAIDPNLIRELVALQEAVGRKTYLSKELNQERNRIIGALRQWLAKACIALLEPDLIILDEFQRFKSLLEGEGEAGELARHLFEYEQAGARARVVLLSATPYRMYGASDDGSEEHYADFLATMDFLLSSAAKSAELKTLLDEFRQAILQAPERGLEPLAPIAERLGVILRSAMSRTERIGAARDASGMLREVTSDEVRLLPDELRAYKALRRVSRLLGDVDPIEYWKSAPRPLSFMESYQIRKKLEAAIDDGNREVVAELKHGTLSLEPTAVKAPVPLPVDSGKAEWLKDRTVGAGMWRCLWLPPALPYYQLESPFSDLPEHARTKQLLFSAWQLVPRSLAANLSHDAEIRAIGQRQNSPDESLQAMRARIGNLLRFDRDGSRPASMAHAGMLFPSVTLARIGDPLDHAGKGTGSLEELASAVRAQLEREVAAIPTSRAEGRVDHDWYWAVPVLLDRRCDPKSLVAFLDQASGPDESDADDEERGAGWRLHLDRLREVATDGWTPSGPPPGDLLDVLALMAISGPGVVALRSLARVTGWDVAESPDGRRQALGLGHALRRLYNLPDATGIIQGTPLGGDYWRQCLRYGAAGCLQAVLDEFAHVAVEDEGIQSLSGAARLPRVAERMRRGLGLRRASVTAQHWGVARNGRVVREPHSIPTRFALRFGEERANDEDGTGMRADEVRAAFNSPFWPFVLITTSIGQEGLDFHWYSHSVIHWNLPNNPVDLEQREGRVHRYKGHAIRRNVARRWGREALRRDGADPWATAFELACTDRLPGDTDLVPYWIYPCEGGVKVERHVPVYPLSKDAARLERLRKALVLYRMVFGQPRQEELLGFLESRFDAAELAEVAGRVRIDLIP